MELLPCSDARHIGESEPVRRDLKVDDLTLNIGDSNKVRVDEDHLILEGFEGGTNVDAYYEFDVDGQNLSSYSHDSDDDNLDQSDDLTLESSQLVLETIESGVLNNNQEGSSHPEIKNLERDEPQAVWVKWRGKWQSGIRCARADWPLATLKAKPTHDRKQYLVIFFPRTRNYSWADVLLVRPIDEYPHPIAYKTHKIGAKMVKDLTLARRFIMQKLAVSMLNILDQLNREGLEEAARDVTVLKDFAMEASRCKDYSDLGRMLLKLQNMILQSFITSDWINQSMQSWKQRCEDANSAECIELLKEELSDSILWNKINLPSSEVAQVDIGSEWKSWKHEVMKWFSFSNPISTAVDSGQPINDTPLTTGGLQLTRKRPKLEVRRPDTHASTSHHSVSVETDSAFFNGYSETLQSNLIEDTVANKWNNNIMPVEAENSEVVKNNDVELTPSNHNRQCIAFIEAKGRQCVRYASEGNVYCCVHLPSRFVSNSAKVESTSSVDSPMCGGTTVLGTKCKHRALVGGAFCKKHRPLDGKSMTSSPVNKFKRKIEENPVYTESTSPKNEENVMYKDPLLDSREYSIQESDMSEKQVLVSDEVAQCIGGEGPCVESPKRHNLYCDNHIPNWLKRARNGKSRIISKEVFIELLKNCHSREQKLHLHQACELFYKLFKSVLSLRNPVPKDVQFQWAVTEASKDIKVGDFLMKLVCSEKERLKKIWDIEDGGQASSAIEELAPIPPVQANQENVIKCKICSDEFLDDQAIGAHWMNSHKKEAQWLFRGYVCAICLDSFTNKKVLEGHVQERHHVQFVEQCMLLQCIPCGGHFGNPDELWLHVLSVHPRNLRLSNNDATQQQEEIRTVEQRKTEDQASVNRRFICRFCGLKFDLLPDLGRHHQAAHMGAQSSNGPRLKKKGIQFYAQKLKPGRPRFKKGLNSAASYKIRNRSVRNLKKRIQASNSIGGTMEIVAVPPETAAASLGRLADSQCSAIAKILISEIKKTKLRPTSSEILSAASSACCRVCLIALLEVKYGALPEKIYLKAAKLCSENNILVEWHREGFVCPKGCMSRVVIRSPVLSPLGNSVKERSSCVPSYPMNSEWTMDECHFVIDSRYFSMDLSEKNVVLCDDISFGKESVPIACVVDENILNAEGPDGQISEFSFPWESFTYVTKPILNQSPVIETESLQLGCACGSSMCSSETCDHVYLFDNDYEDAKDIYGKPMIGRFPYDERGRIILEEGYLVYECNQRCRCSKACRNRVLQKGVQVKLEIFKTDKKGWAVRARQSILRGTFVCEYIGEVIDEAEANERQNRYDKGGRYFYEIDARINDMSRLIEGQVPYVIDATNYGNVSRYVNHSCSPNLVNHQVLVESMDSQLAHIGLYASRDIALGEELTYDFRYKLLPGEGCPCLCGASNCRGRLY